MRYFNQIIFEMRHQKMMMWISIGGTALSIFLVMAFYMSNHVTTAPVAPELDRARIVSGQPKALLRSRRRGKRGFHEQLAGRSYGRREYHGCRTYGRKIYR